MKPLIIATDIDGTLTRKNRTLDPRVLEQLARLTSMGAHVILVSSHAFPAVSTLAEYMGVRYLVAETGSCGGRPWEPLYIEPLPNRDEILDILMRHGFKPTSSNRFRLADISIDHGDQDPVKRIKVISRILRRFRVNIVYSGYAIHISRSGIDKGYGLRKLLDIIGINATIVAMGDGLNDIPLFHVADLSIAPSNAPLEVKKEATIVLPFEYSDAAYHALANIENFFKLRKMDLKKLSRALMK